MLCTFYCQYMHNGKRRTINTQWNQTVENNKNVTRNEGKKEEILFS